MLWSRCINVSATPMHLQQSIRHQRTQGLDMKKVTQGTFVIPWSTTSCERRWGRLRSSLLRTCRPFTIQRKETWRRHINITGARQADSMVCHIIIYYKFITCYTLNSMINMLTIDIFSPQLTIDQVLEKQYSKICNRLQGIDRCIKFTNESGDSSYRRS